ncbi:VanW family protein [Miltoncostaea marina]|uniref:VanW family protein n=1 Tax=Miltoncostaea marina TaxID=2843215 RepID=UPI001C3C7674|nr:VanW family protein [Miltoncostaea marina]
MRLLRDRRPETLVTLVAAVSVLLLAVGVVAYRVATAPGDRVPAGTSIAGVEVGGLTADEAERAVLAGAPDPPGTMRIALDGEPGFPLEVPVEELGPRPRARLAVREAMERRSLFDRVLAEVGLPRGREVSLRYRVTGARAQRIVADVAGRVDAAARPAEVGVGGGRVVVTPSRRGRAVDRAALSRRIAGLADRVEVPVEVVEPEVTDAEAEAARARAARMVARKVRVRGAGREAVVPRAVLLSALRFPSADGAIGVELDPDTIAAAVVPAFEGVLREPVSASFAVSGDRVSVVPSRDGRRLDAATLADRIERRGGAAAVRVAIDRLPPERSTDDANRMRIRELVSEFSTPYACCQPRVQNIKRAAQILDGTIIPAGAQFSLNEAMGERTRARGFVAAPQINAGKLEDAVGGGVSQMATTVFNAAFFAGLRIVTHMPHEFWITRYPAGREATVSWGGPEMIVENDWPAAILLKVSATDTGVTVRMYSSKLGRRVTTETIGDPVAGTAFRVEYTRKVWAGDALKRDERFTWSYKAPPAE